MRLIDADKLLYDDIDCTDGNTYMVVYAPQIDNAPTAFDLESAIEQIESMAKESDDRAKLFEKLNDEKLTERFVTRSFAYREVITILKSVANATNGG